MKKARVLILEDDALLSSLLLDWFAQKPDWEVVGHATNGEDGIQLCRTKKPDLVLVDVAMPRMDGLTAAQQIRQERPETKLLVLTCHSDPFTIQQVHKIGAQGYVSKTSSLVLLAEAIQNILAGGTYYDETFRRSSRPLAAPEAFHKILSPREIEVLRLVAEGYADALISSKLGISPNTVAAHRRSIRIKLDAHNDRDMVFYARQWGLSPTRPPPDPTP